MADNVVFPRKLLRRFIDLYKEQECLWNKDCNNYKRKKMRHQAITKLTELVQQYDSTATRVHILRKIESLRACVRREFKRVRDSRLTATCPEEIYTPNLWYYESLSFAFEEGNYQSRNRSQHEEQAAKSEEEDNNDVEEIDDVGNHDTESYVTYDNICRSNQIEVADTSSASAKRYQGYEEEKGKRHCTEIEDEYDAIGINVAAKLRNLPPNMRIVAEKLINDVLYQAQTNGLNSSSVITTPDPFK